MNESLNQLDISNSCKEKKNVLVWMQTAHHNVAEADCDGYAYELNNFKK